MRIEDLRFLIEVAQSKSITLTAEKMHISQQGLSQLINRIEHDLNSTMFTRCRQGVTLTEAGQMTIIKAKEILEKYNELLDNLESLSQEKTHPLTGSLTLYHSHHSAMEVIPRALKLFRTKFPEVKFNMMEYAPIEAISKIREDPSTVGITNFPEAYYNDNEKLSDYINPDLCSCEICHSDLHVCIPKSWPLAKKKNITRNELGKQLMVYYDTLQYEDIVSIIFKGNKEMPVPFLKTLNNDLYRQAILDGLAFGLVSTLEYHSQRLLKEHTVLTSIRIPLVYNWVSSGNYPTSVEAQEFLKCLKFSLKNN